ncbi:MAG: hypothetical protein J3K34DRAFT_513236, partial [Monoraphidium minutum]
RAQPLAPVVASRSSGPAILVRLPVRACLQEVGKEHHHLVPHAPWGQRGRARPVPGDPCNLGMPSCGRSGPRPRGLPGACVCTGLPACWQAMQHHDDLSTQLDALSKTSGVLGGLARGAEKIGLEAGQARVAADAAPGAGGANGAAGAQLVSALKLLAPRMQALSAPGGAPGADEQARPRVSFEAPPDVDAAKRAVGAALAGLDLQTARVNLDASKAAVTAMRANGELPQHPRKAARDLRSTSMRQLGSAAPLRHNLPLGGGGNGAAAAALGAAGLAGAGGVLGGMYGGGAGAGGAGMGARRLPPGRSISMPYVMHGRSGMQQQLAASLAQDAAMQQQLQLLQGAGLGAPGGGAAAAAALQLQQLQLQHAGAGGAPAAAAGGWGGHAGGVGLGQPLGFQQQQQGPSSFDDALLPPMAAHSGGGAPGGGAVVLAAGGASAAEAGAEAEATALLDLYGSSSWESLVLAHTGGGAAPRAALAQEQSLLSAAAAAFGALPAPGAAHQLALVAAAAQRHLALGGGLTAAAGAAVHLLAGAAAPLCVPPGGAQPVPELLEAALLALETLSLTSPDLAARVARARAAARAAPPPGPDGAAAAARRRAAAAAALAALSGYVDRNQQLLATMSGVPPAAPHAPATQAPPPGAGAGASPPPHATPLANYFAAGVGSGPLDALPPALAGGGLGPGGGGGGGAGRQGTVYSPQLYSPLSSPLAGDLSDLLLDPSGQRRGSAGSAAAAGGGSGGGGGGGGALPMCAGAAPTLPLA